MSLRDLHQLFAWVLLLANATAGLWCLGAHRAEAPRVRRRGAGAKVVPRRTLRVRVERWLWPAVAVAQALVFVEVALGVALMRSLELEAEDLPDLHVLYGASAIVVIAVLYGYRSTSPWVQERQFLVYAGGSFFIMGLAIRELFLV